MSYVVAIDVGIKNMGICIFDFHTAKIVEWDNVSLVRQGRYIPAQNVQYVREFVKRFAVYFENAFQILVERQMRCNMRIIEAVLETMFADKCIIVNARSVKAHYNIGMRNYRANKQKAVEWAKTFVANNPGVFASVSNFSTGKKQDDLADSLLLVMYYLDTYSNCLTASAESILTNTQDEQLQG